MSTNVQFVKKSGNGKIGAMPCTTSPRSTCPDACPMKGDTSCYAEGGYYTRLNWSKVDSGERGLAFPLLLKAVAGLKPDTVWRHNVAGDLQGHDDTIDKAALEDLTLANEGRKGFTYSHYPMTPENLEAISSANQGGFTVNVSCNSPQEASALLETTGGLVPLVTLIPDEHFWEGHRSQGAIVRCPAEYREEVTCLSCQLCQKANRSTIVGFTAHGAGKAKTAIIARG